MLLEHTHFCILEEELKSNKREQEFALGRRAACEALVGAGLRPLDIPRGENGEPIFPDGFVGSISHTQRRAGTEPRPYEELIAIAIVSNTHRSLGIDLEAKSRTVTAGSRIGTDKEFALLEDQENKELMLLSAKETLFKLLYPLCRTKFYFKDAFLAWKDDHFIAKLETDLGEEFKKGFEVEVFVKKQEEYLISYAAL